MSASRNCQNRIKWAIFACLPALVLLVGAEIAVRTLTIVQPWITSVPLPGEGTLLVSDPDLFWSLRPSHRQKHMGTTVVTNELGLRSEPIKPRDPNEFRILSLGESSTFGTGVLASETYTALLADRLQELEEADGGHRRFSAINAGVPAFSSFQSLEFLKTRGLALEPDLLLIYHELNDYLPSALRDSSNNEIGVLMTDRELHETRHGWLHRISSLSALVQFLRLRVARWRINAFEGTDFDDPLDDIGLKKAETKSRLREWGTPFSSRAGLVDSALGQRVSESEREEILSEFVRIAEAEGILLILVHPSYRASQPHECSLTRFAKENGLVLFDAQPILHPPDTHPRAQFRDSWHPNRRGHEDLATHLSTHIWPKLAN